MEMAAGRGVAAKVAAVKMVVAVRAQVEGVRAVVVTARAVVEMGHPRLPRTTPRHMRCSRCTYRIRFLLLASTWS